MRSGLTEPLVTDAGDGATAKVDPGPTTFAVGQNGSTITGKVYRYVTWRDENCPATVCDGAAEHEARDRRGESGPGRQHRAAQPAVVLHRDQRSERRAPRLHRHGRRKRVRDGRAPRAHRSSTSTTSPATTRSGTAPSTTPPRAATTPATRPRSAPRRRATPPAPTTDSMKQPDAMGTQPPTGQFQHADLRVLGGSRRRLPRRPRDDAQGDHLPHLVLVLGGGPATRARRLQVRGARLDHAGDGGRGFHLSGRATVSVWTADPRWRVRAAASCARR